MSKPKCPVCQRVGKQVSPGMFRCGLGHLFDSNPFEGGTAYTDPTKRLEVREMLGGARAENDQRRGRAQDGFRFGR